MVLYPAIALSCYSCHLYTCKCFLLIGAMQIPGSPPPTPKFRHTPGEPVDKATIDSAMLFAQAEVVQSGQLGLPCWLREKIKALKFVDMNELLPETWSTISAVDVELPFRRSPVTDIVMWTECFAMMASVLVEMYPNKSFHLFAYLSRIARAARNFHNSAWVDYDRRFRRQALARRSLDWGIEDPVLYNEMCVSQPQVTVQCNSLSELHSTEVCPDLSQFMGLNVQPVLSSTDANLKPSCSSHQQSDICRKYNEGRCTHLKCKYSHECKKCNLSHPVTSCPDVKQQGERSPSKKRRR